MRIQRVELSLMGEALDVFSLGLEFSGRSMVKLNKEQMLVDASEMKFLSPSSIDSLGKNFFRT